MVGSSPPQSLMGETSATQWLPKIALLGEYSSVGNNYELSIINYELF